MKLFHFYRTEDESGVSGTGPVVEGVQFTNGWCALRWMSKTSSICFYQSLEEVRAIHGHFGKTDVVVHDFEPPSRRTAQHGSRQFEILLAIIEEAARITSHDGSQCIAGVNISQSIQVMRDLLDELEQSFSERLQASA